MSLGHACDVVGIRIAAVVARALQLLAAKSATDKTLGQKLTVHGALLGESNAASRASRGAAIASVREAFESSEARGRLGTCGVRSLALFATAVNILAVTVRAVRAIAFDELGKNTVRKLISLGAGGALLDAIGSTEAACLQESIDAGECTRAGRIQFAAGPLIDARVGNAAN